MYDVIVIGNGLAGMIAAAVACERGCSVLVISKGLGNLYSSSGFIDILGYFPGEKKAPCLNIDVSLEKLINSHCKHPYKIVGRDAVNEACNYFLKLTERIGYPYEGTHNQNYMLPTAAGALAPTALVPPTSSCNLKNFEKILIVGFEEYIDFYPGYVAKNLKGSLKKHGINASVESYSVQLGLSVQKEFNSYDVSLQLENIKIQDKLIKVLKDRVTPGTLVAFPAVLGNTRWQEVYNRLRQELGSEVIEIPTLPPSITGMRLAEALTKYLREKGVEIQLGLQAEGIVDEEGECKGIAVKSAGGKTDIYSANNFILATGGILGGGIRVSSNEFREVVFGIPVMPPEKEWTVSDFFSTNGQPYAYSGIMVNEELRPLDEDGNIVISNVHCAGRNLCGYDPFIEKSGNGVALVTGYRAGLAASEGGVQGAE